MQYLLHIIFFSSSHCQFGIYSDTMLCAWLLRFLCALIYIKFTSAKCTASLYETGPSYWLKCSNASIATVSSEKRVLSAITISNSNVKFVPANSFDEHKRTLIVLNLYSCELRDLSPNAFTDFPQLEKLSLAHNKLTTLQSSSFSKLPRLEQLDISFNKIQIIQNDFFRQIPTIRLLNLDGNQLNCLKPNEIQYLSNLAKIRILGNSLSLICRGQLTLWLKDHRINYSNERPNGMESWLDSLLWLCAIEDDVIAKSEEKIKQCVILGMFNQFKESIVSLDDYLNTKNTCVQERKTFLNSLSDQNSGKLTNAVAIDKMINVIGQFLSN